MIIDEPASLSNTPYDYSAWLSDLKTRIHSAQQRAALNRDRPALQIATEVNHAKQ